MRLLVLESSAEDKNNASINMQNCDNQTKFNEADDCTTQSREDVLNSNIQLENRYSALEDQLTVNQQQLKQFIMIKQETRKEKENLNQRVSNLQTNPIRIYQTTRYSYSRKNSKNQRQRHRSL
jgi:hypothetical protein